MNATMTTVCEIRRLALAGLMIFLVSFLLALDARAQTKPPAAAVECPETMTVTESAAPVKGWNATAGTTERHFERISVVNVKQGEREYDLAPDDEKRAGGKIPQTWNLKDYREMTIFLVCRYRYTSAVLTMDLPAPLQTCSFTFELDGKNEITGKPRMQCT